MSDAVAALVSGGIESMAMLDHLAGKYKMVIPLYVVSGLVWEPAERFWLRRFYRKMNRQYNTLGEIIDISAPASSIYRRGHWALEGGGVPGIHAPDSSVELPGRNIQLLTVSGIFCKNHGVKEIAIGTLGSNIFPDATPRFFEHFEQLMAEGLRQKLKIITPLIKFKKSQVIKRGRELPLDLTFSCLSPKGQNHCGQCNKCGERQRAFGEAGVKDPTIYEQV